MKRHVFLFLWLFLFLGPAAMAISNYLPDDGGKITTSREKDELTVVFEKDDSSFSITAEKGKITEFRIIRDGKESSPKQHSPTAVPMFELGTLKCRIMLKGDTIRVEIWGKGREEKFEISPEGENGTLFKSMGTPRPKPTVPREIKLHPPRPLALVLPDEMKNARNETIVNFFGILRRYSDELNRKDDFSYSHRQQQIADDKAMEQSDLMRAFKEMTVLNRDGREAYFSGIDAALEKNDIVLLQRLVTRHLLRHQPDFSSEENSAKYLAGCLDTLFAVAPESAYYAKYVGFFPVSMMTNLTSPMPPAQEAILLNAYKQLRERQQKIIAESPPESELFQSAGNALATLKTAELMRELSAGFRQDKDWPDKIGRAAENGQSPYRMCYLKEKSTKDESTNWAKCSFMLLVIYSFEGQDFYCYLKYASEFLVPGKDGKVYPQNNVSFFSGRKSKIESYPALSKDLSRLSGQTAYIE